MTPRVSVAFAPTPEGIADARREIDELEETMVSSWSSKAATGGASTATTTSPTAEPAVMVYERTVDDGRSRELLEKLPGGAQDALMPEELGEALDPDEPLTKASVRAIYRNIRRAEGRLRKEGLITDEVVRVDFGGYGKEGAGRYYVSEHDRKALDTYLGR